MPAPDPASDAVHVAIDVTPMLGFRTGIGVAVTEIVSTITDRSRRLGIELVPYALSLRARRERARVPSGTRFPPLPARSLLWAWPRFGRPRLDRFLRPAQLVHATNYLSAPSRLPTLVSVWDCSFVRYPAMSSPEVRAFEPAVRAALRRGAHVHTASHAIAAEIDDLFGPGLAASGRMHVIPMGIPPALIPRRPGGDAGEPGPTAPISQAGSERPFVLALGRHEPRKDYPLLVAAFGAVAQLHRDLRLVLAGPRGPDRGAVLDAIDALPGAARARVDILDAVDDATKEQLLARATVLAYPSRYEGFGFPILEAMRAGVPVVATETGSIPEVAGDAAVLVPPGDQDALAEAISRLVSDVSRRSELADAGRRRASEFSWLSTAEAFAALYRELAS